MKEENHNPFWQWSLERYSRKPVELALLKLQDECGFDVNVALWCCWRAELGASITDDELRGAIEVKREWTANVVHPLRAARRYIKSIDKGNNEDISRLRAHVKAAELDAEKHVQNLLFQFDQSAAKRPLEKPGETALLHLNRYAELLGAEKNPAFSRNLLQDLVDNIFEQAQGLPNKGSGRNNRPAGEQR